MAIGRISGPLLKANLLRQGVNLAFENDLLFLKVASSTNTTPRVGINTNDPQYDLDVNGTTRAPQLQISTLANIGSVSITGTTISTTAPTLTLGAADNVIYQNKLTVDSIDIENNVISTNVSGRNLELRPNGSGTVEIFANTNVTGNIVATGSITANGNITIGSANDDNVVFNAEIDSNIVPNINNSYSLGSSPKQWANVWTQNLVAGTVTASSITVDGIDLALRQGNIFYVAENGSNSYSGTHPNDPYTTLKHALSQATSGDTIHIYPGVYQEIFPMTVPTGVTVKGHSIRGVNITPTVGTQSLDAFLLNGGSTIEDLTISGFYTGYAFKFAPGFTVSGNNRSPYIRNISVITQGSVTSGADPRGFAQGDAGKGAYIDGAVASATSLEATMLFHSATFITPGVDAITITNGARVEWLNSFTYFANRGIYGLDGATGLRGAGKTAVRVSDLTGTIVNGNTFSYYASNGTTVLATGTINGVDVDGKFYVNGNLTGLETAAARTGKTITRYNNPVTDTAIKKYGSSSLQLDGVEDYIGVASNNDFAFSSDTRISKTVTVNGNSAVSAVQSKFGGSSIAFDGTGDYLSVASTSDFAFGTSNWTIEFWAYRTITQLGTILNFVPVSGSTPSHQMNLSSTGVLRYAVSGATVITGSALALNTWVHIAVSRSEGSTKLFVNGTQSGSTYTDTNNYSVDYSLTIGAGTAGVSGYGGYLDDIRISNTARYTTTFTPSVTAFTADSSSKLLIHGDSTIVDDVGSGTSTNFTVEGYFYFNSVAAIQMLFDFRAGANTDVAPVLYTSAGELRYYSYNTDRIVGPTLAINTWYHIAVSRSAGTTRLFVNGVSRGTPWVEATDYGVAKPLIIGARWDGTDLFFNGYVDEFRVSRTARYSANFGALTAAFVSDANTALLLHFNNVGDSSIIIEDDTLNAQDIRFSNGATARYVTLADTTDFGAEVRAIASACVYGNYGIVGNGAGVLMYLISQNLAYIGVGQRTDNDDSAVIQANEVVELNNASIRYSSVDHKGDFRVGDLFYVNQTDGTVNFSSSTFNINTSAGITITTGASTTTITGDGVDTGNLRISGNTISSLSGDINLDADSGTVRINSTSALQLPKGNRASRPTASTGMIRYNTEDNIFEGYDGNWIALNGVYSLDLATRITAELTPGANDNTIRFYINNNVVTTIDATKLSTPRIEVDSISIDSNIITTETVDTDLVLSANGTGAVVIDNLAFKNSTITNRQVNGVLNFQQEGSGYFKIAGTNGFVVPVGTNVQRPASAYRETGMTRYNTEQRYLEIWDGFSWVSVAGATGSISLAAAEDLVIEYALTLG